MVSLSFIATTHGEFRFISIEGEGGNKSTLSHTALVQGAHTHHYEDFRHIQTLVLLV
jgi:hypothetical protein